MGSLAWDTTNGHVGKTIWWKDATFYQVYPASFKDSNGDGWGDLPGLISELDYLHDLGVDVIWVSPIFESPQKDMGYDVSDYQKIYAPYGTIEDVDRLVDESHRRGMKVILDLVINHTSVEHAWFKESRSTKNNPKRDWYIWKQPRYIDGVRCPPTNWRGYFACPTWTWDEHTQEYYLHLYAPDQPDLNWENEDCREAIYEETMRFWLDRGVDGFRIDTVNKYSKRQDFVDAPVTDLSLPHQPAPEMWCNGPRIHEFIREMNEKALAPYGAVSVGELSNMRGPADVAQYVSASARELDMVFEFSLIRLGTGNILGGKYVYQPYPLSRMKELTQTWQRLSEGNDAWQTVFMENHDNGRAVSRFGDVSTPALWAKSAKVLALWQATLTGTLFLYQGQEIGMTNMPESWPIEEYKDIESRNFFAEALESGDKARIEKTMHGIRILARDHSRLPFQWNDAPNSGFTNAKGRPWMRVHDDFKEINVARQRKDPFSVLSFYKRALKLRKEHRDLFIHGTFTLLDPANESVFAYVKESAMPRADGDLVRRKAVVVLNMSRDERPGPDISDIVGESPRVLVGTNEEGPFRIKLGRPVLGSWEGRVYVNFEE